MYIYIHIFIYAPLCFCLNEIDIHIQICKYRYISVGSQGMGAPDEESGWCELLVQMQFDSMNRGWYTGYAGEFPSIHSLTLGRQKGTWRWSLNGCNK